MKDIKFFMFNKFYPKEGRQIFMNNEQRLKNLDKSLPLVFYIHGFTESAPGSPRQSAYEIREGKVEFIGGKI